MDSFIKVIAELKSRLSMQEMARLFRSMVGSMVFTRAMGDRQRQAS
jgi:hypothetical protein